MDSVTQYFLNAVTSQCNNKIDFSKDKFVILEQSDFEKGLITESVFDKCIEVLDKNRNKMTSFNVLIATKTVISRFDEGVRQNEQPDDLTSVFFIPAVLMQNRTLKFCNKFPIIPREYLEPMIEADLSIGKIERLNQYLSQNIAEFKNIESWSDYLDFSKKMFKFVTGQPFDVPQLNESIKFDGKYYLFKDCTIYASKEIAELYENIQCQTIPLPLYQRFTATKAPKTVQLTSISNKDSMLTHCASMGAEHPLSPSQREAVIHFNQLADGEILAVNGPPGTGKTTLLQSIVAGVVTEHALMKKEPPIIIASSTNNQAVTNIIDSFGEIKSVWQTMCIEEHWLPKVNSFAVFFPSASKMADIEKDRNSKKAKVGSTSAKENEANYQLVDEKYTFLAQISSQEYKKKASKNLLAKYTTYSGKRCANISDCKAQIHIMLSDVDKLRKNIISKTANISRTAKPDVQTFLKSLAEKIQECQIKMDALIEKKKQIQSQNESITERMKQWEDGFEKLPFLVRLLKFSKFSKIKIRVWYLSFRTEEEILFLAPDDTSIDKIIEKYIQRIKENDTALMSAQKECSEIEKQQKELQRLKEQTEKEIDSLVNMIRENENAAQIFTVSNFNTLRRCVLDETNNVMDTTLRYLEFWLAVHYYECKFLEQETFTEKQLSINVYEVLIKKLLQIAMVSPCMVMTFYMLPKKLIGYRINEQKKAYLYNFADLLIADEAGQISPEIAAASFALAKKAVVVGDDYQIPPVWGTSYALDVTLAVESGTINSVDEFKQLETNGLNVSESSLMRAASFSCRFHKFGPGLFLSEHRRCFDEIILYCNELLYAGHLEPLRGVSDCKLPCMGYHDIPIDHAEKDGNSRANKHEAEEIAKWLNRNFEKICSQYPNEDRKNILAVITPFKAQTKRLKRAIREYCTDIPNAEKIIEVGTVHIFQGAERRIIIFSTVYGSEDNCGFIDGNKNLMNVAVSRAKDAFWVFGSIGCLKGKPHGTASGLMYSHIKNNLIGQMLSLQ